MSLQSIFLVLSWTCIIHEGVSAKVDEAARTDVDCTTFTNEQICFGKISNLGLKIMENRPRTILTHLGQRQQSQCPSYKLNYSVILTSHDDNKDLFEIEEAEDKANPFKLWVRADLDRESVSFYNFTLVCTLRLLEGNLTLLKYTIPGELTVLDEDDNPPTTGNKLHEKTVYISVHPDKNEVKQGSRLRPDGNHTELTFEDNDSESANNFDVIITNDTKELIQVKKLIHELNHKKFSSTYGILQVFLRNSRIGVWDGLYCVLVVVNDTSLVAGRGNPLIHFNICLHRELEPPTSTEREIEPSIPTNREIEAPTSTDQHSQDAVVCSTSCVLTLFSFFTFLMMLLIIGLTWKTRCHRMPGAVKSSLSPPLQLLPVNGSGGGSSVIGRGYGDYVVNGHLISDTDYIGPNTNLQQLPPEYPPDEKFELPRSSIVLLGVIGEGEFGQVYRAFYHPPGAPRGVKSSVAVKVLRNEYLDGPTCRREFMAEYELLKLVEHNNVIKLIGACTHPDGPLFLIMEYCELGSLRNFLRKYRNIDDSLLRQRPSRFKKNLLVNIEEEVCEPNFVQYSVSPADILGFSWQIAKGMAYISEMKMVHRDLAARNVLLTSNKVCKISDFGMGRDIYVDDAYRKKSKDRVPVKWLALECLCDELYTTKSDVWSFGVLLMELVQMGETPYPGIKPEQMYEHLKNGHRMSKPLNCSDELYAIMRKCWLQDPNARPSFPELVDSLGHLLADGIDYLQLNIPVVSNPTYGLTFSTTSHSESNGKLSTEISSAFKNSEDESSGLIQNEISGQGGKYPENGASPSYPNGRLTHNYMNVPKDVLDGPLLSRDPRQKEQLTSSRVPKILLTPRIPSISVYESPIKRKPLQISSSPLTSTS